MSNAYRLDLIASANELMRDVDRVLNKYGVQEDGTPKDWTEWQDVRDSLAVLRSKLAAPEKEETK